MRISRLFFIGLCGLTLMPSTAWSQRRPGDAITPEQVRKAIENGAEYLKRQQRNGAWEHHMPALPGVSSYDGGLTALAMLALLESGVDPDDPVITDGLNYLRKLPPRDTYVVGLQTMVLAKAKPKDDLLLIQRNVDWLKKTVKRDGNGRLLGWAYPEPIREPDHSNSQYAVLALREASLAGVPIDDQLWKEIQDFYVRSQKKNGGWTYHPQALGDNDRITMTAAGVCGLLITGMQLYRSKETIEPDGTIRNCGDFDRDDKLALGLNRLGEQFTVDFGVFKFYNLYGIERAGRLSGQRFFVGQGGQLHDWYRAGVRLLVRSQGQLDGAWRGGHSQIDGHPVIATSFALLFLAKGKTPVLMHKVVHGMPHQERGMVGDWNNDRNDVRNLTEFCSHQVFRKAGRPVPLTWQSFDASKLDPASPDSVAEMLQAPIAFINGHLAPRFTDGEKRLLKEYVEQGGFIFAEACCGRKEFDQGFRQLMKELWPDRDLRPILPGHAIWNAAFPVPGGSFGLEGIDFGCKVGIVYSPQDMSCHWESNRFDGPNDKTILAFRTGANVVAYATGLEPPEDKLTVKEVTSTAEDKIVRNHLQVAQIDYGGPDWQPAPNAMRNLMDHVHKEWGVDVILQTRAIKLGDVNLPNYKFLYLHGRREFSMSEDFTKKMREHLETGGMLLADACCGSERFDEAFRKWMKAMFPDRTLEPIKADDVLLSDKIGKAVRTVQCRTQRGGAYSPMAPQLEGIRADPKDPRSPWIVVYSKYDLGCALDRHASTDCLGYNHESALEIAAQVVLYALRE